MKKLNKKRLKKVFTPFVRMEMPSKYSLPISSRIFSQKINEVWRNNLYLVFITYLDLQKKRDGSMHVWVRLVQDLPIHNWHDLQRIKNELVGEAREAIEIYPKANELVDDANWYHLWVLPKAVELRQIFPEFRLN